MTKGVLIVGHGSRFVFNKMTMDMHARILTEKGIENIYIGFNETSMPSIEDAISQMVDDGIDDIVAVPFFVASGLHMVRDIPKKLGLAHGVHDDDVVINGKNVRMRFETPFGEDENLTDILCERIIELSSGKGKRGIIVMGHGSRLHYNSEIMELNAKRLRDRGYGDVRVGYNEFNEPKIDLVVKAMIDDGVDEIIALPLFIASGAHLSMDIPKRLGIPMKTDSGTLDVNGREVVIKYALPIGNDPRLSDIIVKKVRRHHPEKVLVLDMTHGGQILSRRYKGEDCDVTCADVYRIAPEALKNELKSEGITVADDNVAGHYDLAVMPCHCPDYFLKGCTYGSRIYFSEAVNSFADRGRGRIEITGVKGKTSTCHVLAHILDTAGKKVYLSTSRGRGPWVNGKVDPIEWCSIAPPYILTLPEEGYDFVICEVSLGGSGKADIAGITNLVEDYGIAKDTRKASEAKKAVLCDGINIVPKNEMEMWGRYGKGKIVGYGGRITVLDKPEFGKGMRISVDYDGIWETELRGDYLAIQYVPAMEMALEFAHSLGISADAAMKALSGFRGVPGRGEISVMNGVRRIVERNPGISRLSVSRTLEMLDGMGVLDNAIMVVDPVSRKVCDKMHMPEIEVEAKRFGVEMIVTAGDGVRPVLPRGKTTIIEFIKEGYQ